MKRILPLLFAMLISVSLIIVPVFASEAAAPDTEQQLTEAEVQAISTADIPANLVKLTVSSHLGEITLVLPSGVGSGSLVLDGQYLRNMTSSTLYVFCPEFPDYIFSASRFDVLTYRDSEANNYQTVDLIVTEVKSSVPSFEEVFPWIFLALVILSALFAIWERR